MIEPTSSLHFAFCVNDGYVPYICVTIKGIIENHRNHKVIIHVLSDYISVEKKKLLGEVVNGYHAEVIVHIVDDTPLRGLKDSWSIYTWYRLLIPEYLATDIHRVLYLDADTIVCSDISELFTMDMDGYAVAGCIDPESFNNATYIRCNYAQEKQYICAGVLLMNLDMWREYHLSKTMVAFSHKNKDWIWFVDQETINVLCQDTKIVLPLKYGIMDYFFKEDRFYQNPYKEQLLECIEKPAIVHYAGQSPWKRELATAVMQDEWNKYNQMLLHPAKMIYITKGWQLVKMLIWNALHPNRQSDRLTKEKVLRKLEEVQ